MAKIAINRELCSKLTSFNCYFLLVFIRFLHHCDSLYSCYTLLRSSPLQVMY
nr:MAG TPA: hypothetical protein [Caudoviricetes sp.]